MKKTFVFTLFTGLVLLLSSFTNTSGSDSTDSELEWHTSLEKVYELSKESGKPIFGFFTGSDWCGWCIKLQRDVFAKQAFIDWAKDEVILLELDFPRNKQLPEEQVQQNRELQAAFKVTGYPTVWIFNAEKDPVTNHYSLSALGKLGYPSGAIQGKEEVKFLETANSILKSGE